MEEVLDVQQNEEVEEPKEPTFTQEQVDAIVQKRLKAAERKHAEALKEQERIAQLSAEEAEAERIRAIEEENNQLKNTLKLSEVKAVTRNTLSEAGVNVSEALVDLLSSTDEDESAAKVDAFLDVLEEQKQAWTKALNAETAGSSIQRAKPAAAGDVFDEWLNTLG